MNGTILDPHHFARLEQHLGTRLLDPVLHLLHDLFDFLFGNRRRLVGRTTNKTGDFRRALDEMPRLVVHLHLDQHITREELPLGNALLARLQFDDFLDGNQHLTECILHSLALNTLDERALHAFFEPRVGMNDIPPLAHDFLHPRIRSYSAHSILLSVIQRKNAMTTTKANTNPVVCKVSLRDGQTTFLASAVDSLAKPKN